jgi:pyridoxamine 5'-phosphate oxidase
VPPSFLLLRLEIARVELLELGPHPHRRRRWRAADGWREERLNP